jgi:ABC-type transporter Mla subunit MlaD
MQHLLANLNPLTEWAIAFVSAVGILFQVRWSRRSAAIGPTLLTTLGIFFCFMGIALGLADFDPNDVKSSVPHLLQGIRTSFWVSVTGIGWALTIKIRLAIFGDAALQSGQTEGATVNDLVNQLVALNTAVAGTSETSLLGQSRLARTDVNARLEKIIDRFDQYAMRTAEENSRVLIAALAEVVHDFNSKLNDQFGQNFKELNHAAARLVTWQVQHEEELRRMIERDSTTSEAMSRASESYAALVDKSTVFVGTAASLDSLLENMNAKREELSAHIQLLAQLVDKASDGLPRIEQQIVEMTNQIARGVQKNQEMLGSVLKSSWQSIQVHNQHLTTIIAKSLEAAQQEAAAHKKSLVA